MDLKDLADEGRGERAGPARAITRVETLERDVIAKGPPVPWVVVASRLLDGEQVLVVFEKKHLKEAEDAHPDKVIYFPPEIDELRRHKGTPDFPQLLRTVHLVKKKLGGWVVPSDSPKGGGNRGTAKRRGTAG